MIVYVHEDLTGMSASLETYTLGSSTIVEAKLLTELMTGVWYANMTDAPTGIKHARVKSGTTVLMVGFVNFRDAVPVLKASVEDPHLTVIEGSYTAEEVLRLISSVLMGLVSGANSSTTVNNLVFKALDGVRTRITATTDNQGNRSVVTIGDTD